MGTWRHVMWDDDWTAVTADGKRTAQFEHTMLVTEDGCDVLTGGPGARLQRPPGTGSRAGLTPPAVRDASARRSWSARAEGLQPGGLRRVGSGDGRAGLDTVGQLEQADGAVGVERAEDQELAAEAGDAPLAQVDGADHGPAEELARRSSS